MKTKAFLPAIVFLLASLASCNSSVPKSLVTDDGSVRIIENPDGPLYICDLKAAGDTIDIHLANWSKIAGSCVLKPPTRPCSRPGGSR